ncbi:hypothetical protein LUZ63_018459 [Rhynchospora breviuscula]|uniref:GH18 domain-containing protein n=1 Tax=Rhynchospora breviuscula TaxID=2022672 RepID=A0A9Q0C4G0_9POAL|nr:hypothetical protein LUZ63_018459 [Rhynchospora breviuscula]
MPNSKFQPLFSNPLFLSFLACILAPMAVLGTNSNHFTEYIGAKFNNVKFSDVPINSGVEFHYILSFAIDYSDATTPPASTNGNFGAFWDTENLSPDAVSAIKEKHSNVKVAVSLGGGTIGADDKVYFKATSVDSWVSNAVSSLTSIIKEYNLDGIDIDYENFSDDENDIEKFTECIGRLITILKRDGVISFASIAPFDDSDAPVRQKMYKVLWSKYSSVIDYVNYQFYGYGEDTTVEQYIKYYDEQVANYPEGRVLASFMTENTNEERVISADRGFSACQELKKENKLYGIFIWSADDSLSQGFTYEKKSQALLTS